MAKNSTKISFSKATIVKDEETGRYDICEIGKENTTVYNLTEILDRFAGIAGVSLTLTSDAEIDPIEINE